MVPVPQHPVAEVAVGELLEVGLGGDARLGVVLVEDLVEDQEPEAVRQRQHLRRLDVVARADGVRPHRLHDLQLPPLRRRVERRAQRPVAVVQVHAPELESPLVQPEAVVRVEPDGADAEGRLVDVADAGR